MSAEEQIFYGPPKVTPEREQAWATWKDDYFAGCVQTWASQGSYVREQMIEAGAIVLHHLSQIDDLPWMPLGEALATRMSMNLLAPRDQIKSDEERITYLRSLRTAETSTEADRITCTALMLGVTVQQAANMCARTPHARQDPDKATTGKTSLYRHFDDMGVLLYVGIAKEPERRAEQHRYNSEWYRFVADTDVEWFASRAEASIAERDAIKTELPIFNSAMNSSNRRAAIDYLFGALNKVGAA